MTTAPPRITAGDAAKVVVRQVPMADLSGGGRLRIEHAIAALRATEDDLFSPPTALEIDGGTAHVVRRFVHGHTLRERLDQGGRLTVPETLALARCMLRALTHLHERGVLHLGIHPRNVIVDALAPLPIERAVLVDVAAPRPVAIDVLRRTELAAAARYQSPEQTGALAQSVDERADLYATGIVLFEALSDSPPFTGTTAGEVIRHHLSTPVPDLASALHIPRALEQVIRRLLGKMPAERYQSAAAVLQDVQDITAALARGEPDPDVVVGRHDVRQRLSEPAFIGRAAELAAVERLLAGDEPSAATHHPLVFVEAESGAGKTRFLTELARRAEARGALVLRGESADEAAPHPLISLRGVLDGVSTAAADDDLFATTLRSALAEHTAALRAAVPPLRSVLGDEGTEPDESLGPETFGEARTVAGLVALLNALRETHRSILVLLDDLQWADDVTLKVVASWRLSERAGAAAAEPRGAAPQLVVLGAFRSDEVSPAHPLRQIEPTARVSLEPFAAADVRRLAESMAGPLPESAVAVTERLAAGSPFMASAVLRGLVETGALVPMPTGWRVEQSALDAVQSSSEAANLLARRLALLTPDTRRLLTFGAVLGREFDPSQLSRIMEDSAEQSVATLAALDEACRRHILWLDPETGRCRFVHDKLREAVLETLDTDALRNLHRAAAAAYEAIDGGARHAGELAYHFDAAGDPERALPHALAAGAAARAQHALAAAERYYAIAERGATGADESTQKRIAEELGATLTLRGRFDEAEGYLRRARDLAQGPLELARADERLSHLAHQRGDHEATIRYVEAALGSLGRPVPHAPLVLLVLTLRELLVQALHTTFPRLFLHRRSVTGPEAERDLLALRLYVPLNYSYSYVRGILPTAWVHFKSLNLAETYPPTEELAQAWSNHAVAQIVFQKYALADRYAERSLEIRTRHRNLWGRGQTLCAHGLVLTTSGKWRGAIDTLRRAERILVRTGDPLWLSATNAYLGYAHFWLGELKTAVGILRQDYWQTLAVGNVREASMDLLFWSYAARGQVPQEALDALPPTQEGMERVMALQARALRLLLAEDRVPEAVQALDQACDIVRRKGIKFDQVVAAALWLSAALRRQAERTPPHSAAERQALLRRAQDAAARGLKAAQGYQNHLPHALRENGTLAAIRGDAKRARRLLDESVACAERRGAPYERALSLLARGEVGRSLGWAGAEADLAEARARLGEAEAFLSLTTERQATLSLADRFDTVLDAGRRIAAALSTEAVHAAIESAGIALLRADRCRLVSTVPDESAAPQAARSSISAPISVRGAVIGHLHATHHSIEGLFGAEERRLADYISTLAGAALENVDGIREIERLNEIKRQEELAQALVRHELAQAREVQRLLLPAHVPSWPGRLEVAFRCQPAREMSGDFYDVSQLPTGELAIAVGDVAGKGIAAALVMSRAQALLRLLSDPAFHAAGAETISAARALRRIGDVLHTDVGHRHFVACSLAIFVPATDGRAPRLCLCNAAQVPPFLVRGGRAEELQPAGAHVPLGAWMDADYQDLELTAESEDVLVFASDGLPEAPRAGALGDRAELFGFDRLHAAAVQAASRHANAEAIAGAMWSEIEAWCGAEPHNHDMTLLVVRVV